MSGPDAPKESARQKRLRQLQEQENRELKTKQQKQEEALMRRRRGRRSLISGSESGIENGRRDTLA